MTPASDATTPSVRRHFLSRPSLRVSHQMLNPHLMLPGPASDAAERRVRRALLSSKTFHDFASNSRLQRKGKIVISIPQKRLLTAQTPLSSQMCQHQQVFTTLCTCVSIFTIIFLKELATQLATPLDPSTYAKLDRSSGTR
jgi:hypothetical protein